MGRKVVSALESHVRQGAGRHHERRYERLPGPTREPKSTLRRSCEFIFYKEMTMSLTAVAI